jgi:hypothetical protein
MILDGLGVRRAAARASPTLPSPCKPRSWICGLLIRARATSETLTVSCNANCSFGVDVSPGPPAVGRKGEKMLVEYKKVSQKEKGIIRKWYHDNYFDLIIWFDSEGNKIGFQLCYNIYGDEKAITLRGKNYSHNKVDDGQQISGSHMTPILVQDGVFEKESVLDKFEKESLKIESELREYVINGIKEYRE